MRRRTIKKNFWFSYKEDRQLKYLSSLLCLSEADTVRRLLTETQVKAAPPKEFYEAIEKINKIGVNINQLARVANATGNIYESILQQEFIKLNKLKDDVYKKYL